MPTFAAEETARREAPGGGRSASFLPRHAVSTFLQLSHHSLQINFHPDGNVRTVHSWTFLRGVISSLVPVRLEGV